VTDKFEYKDAIEFVWWSEGRDIIVRARKGTLVLQSPLFWEEQQRGETIEDVKNFLIQAFKEEENAL
jgi:hypothetical protein